mgnify:CR=1 FL=1
MRGCMCMSVRVCRVGMGIGMGMGMWMWMWMGMYLWGREGGDRVRPPSAQGLSWQARWHRSGAMSDFTSLA